MGAASRALAGLECAPEAPCRQVRRLEADAGKGRPRGATDAHAALCLQLLIAIRSLHAKGNRIDTHCARLVSLCMLCMFALGTVPRTVLAPTADQRMHVRSHPLRLSFLRAELCVLQLYQFVYVDVKITE